MVVLTLLMLCRMCQVCFLAFLARTRVAVSRLVYLTPVRDSSPDSRHRVQYSAAEKTRATLELTGPPGDCH